MPINLNINEMRIAVNGNRRQEGHFQEIARLFTTLLSRGFDVVVAAPFLRMLTERLGDRIGFDRVGAWARRLSYWR